MFYHFWSNPETRQICPRLLGDEALTGFVKQIVQRGTFANFVQVRRRSADPCLDYMNDLDFDATSPKSSSVKHVIGFMNDDDEDNESQDDNDDDTEDDVGVESQGGVADVEYIVVIMQ